MMKVRNFSVTYHGAKEASLSNISLDIEPGRLVLITGRTGSGKSTLLMGLNGILQHESCAELRGEVLLDHTSLRDMPMRRICRQVGTVFQNPASQICTGTPMREAAFGLENLGVERDEMRQRVEQALRMTGLWERRFQKNRTLSGGLQQRLAVAAALAQKPRILLLDEPTGRLDPPAAEEVLDIIDTLKRDANLAVVMVEHRLEGPLEIADEVAVLDKGRLVKKFSTGEASENISVLARLGVQVRPRFYFPSHPSRTEDSLSSENARLPKKVAAQNPPAAKREALVRLCNVTFAYPKAKTPIFQNLSLTIYKGDRIALIGANGTGKSTLLHLLAKTLKPSTGVIERPAGEGTAGLTMQNPDVMLFCDSVEEELGFAPRQLGKTPEKCKQTVSAVLQKMSLSALAERAPFSLSLGERQRTAAASVLTLEPSLLLLDEPTAGQDRAHICRMMTAILKEPDAAVFSSHDMETVAAHADRVILLDRRGIAADGPTEAVLSNWKLLAAASVLPATIRRFAEESSLGKKAAEKTAEASS
jgi:energy-coupling factor transport system ATP-binding protein